MKIINEVISELANNEEFLKRLDDINQEIKLLEKEEKKVLDKMGKLMHSHPMTIEKDGKLYMNKELKEKYIYIRDTELIPIQRQQQELIKKNNQVIEELINEGIIEEKKVEIVDYWRPYLNGKVLYVRIAIRIVDL